jgi:DUF1680 family protein
MAIAILVLMASLVAALTEVGALAYPFEMSQVSLGSGRLAENQERTLRYLKWIDMERLLYNFRSTHKLSTKGAAPNGGWDSDTFRFRSHVQGHFLSAWSQCSAALHDDMCRERALYFVAELAKCQANNQAAGFTSGYLSGFPESEFGLLENGTLRNGNVPYYAVHKTLAGLLDVWRHIGDTAARDVLLRLADWVDARTARLSYAQMQKVMATEFGGMNAIMADLYHQTGDKRWIAVAQRFDHAAVFGPLAANEDRLNGLHANTQIPKWIGSARQYKATGTSKYHDIAKNAWNFTVGAHSYAIGGNSQGEHFHAPHSLALARDTAEGCNTYNMLKLTREIWTLDAESDRTTYFDFYERALLNHLLGQQDADDPHGGITYFTPLKPGGRRGVGPWGESRYSDEHGSFWCCQGTALETNTKYSDSIYFRSRDDSTLFINLFAPSVLKWSQRNLTLTQTTSFPASDSTTLRVNGVGSEWTLRIRIPAWTAGAEIAVNGKPLPVRAGHYASVTRAWHDGDEVKLTLPMRLWTMAGERPDVAALLYGPTVLSGDYGNATLADMPRLDLRSVRKTGTLGFVATANGQAVSLGPFYNAHGVNYNVYWKTSGALRSQ